jgi:hypothetical protein
MHRKRELMPRTTNRGASALIARAEPFTSNGSLRAIQDRTGAYVIYSYNTPIGIIRAETNTVYTNRRKYSSTTSRQQTFARLGLSEYAELNASNVVDVDGADELTTAASADRASYAR